ncbi:MAG: hypothetical protein GF346_08710 [Candidatus Eisenbacteria bacterium]|nr:hypothetical protein [Candidatus Latescibacterota bacterium]MBD3302516.1 hypothetical protein [Candidatus Eisenbacteria bacterium]
MRRRIMVCFRSVIVLIGMLFASPAVASIGEVVTTLPAPGAVPAGLALQDGRLWCADWENGTLFEIDPATGAVTREQQAPCVHPEGLASDGERLYISEYGTGMIYAYDPETRLTVHAYRSPGGSPKGLAYGGGSLWLVDDGEDRIYELVPFDGTAKNYFKAPLGNCLGLAHDGERLWVTDRGADELYAVVPDDGTVLFLVKTLGPYPYGLAMGNDRLWSVDFERKEILALSLEADPPYRVSEEVERSFRFRYDVRNDGPGMVKTASIHLAVPYEELENQMLLGPIRWDPQPDRFVEDRWGQEIAVFAYEDLQPGATATAQYSVPVRLGELHYAFYPEDVGPLKEVPTEVRSLYTAPTSRLQLEEEIVRETARKVVGDETNPYWIGRKLFDWVRENLEYERVGGWDVPTTLIKRGTGSCSEYAFLYIALCRSVGLPARYEGSVVVRGDDASVDDVYHRWCEIYLPRIGWMPVDPSGGDSDWPAHQTRYFGGLANRYIITTHGGGDSEYLSWGYNGHSVVTTEGRTTVIQEGYGVWSPAPEETSEASPSLGEAR